MGFNSGFKGLRTLSTPEVGQVMREWVWGTGGMTSTGENRRFPEKSLSRGHSITNLHMKWPGAEPGLPRWKAGITIVNNEFQGVWKYSYVAYLRYYPRLSIERLGKITKNISQCNRYSKYGLTESEGKYLTISVGRRILLGLGIIYTHII